MMQTVANNQIAQTLHAFFQSPKSTDFVGPCLLSTFVFFLTVGIRPKILGERTSQLDQLWSATGT